MGKQRSCQQIAIAWYMGHGLAALPALPALAPITWADVLSGCVQAHRAGTADKVPYGVPFDAW